MRAEAANGAFLDGDQHLVFARQARHQVLVERLAEPRIRDSGGKALGAQVLRRLQAFLQARAEIEDRDLGAFLDDAALADRNRRAALRQLEPNALAAYREFVRLDPRPAGGAVVFSCSLLHEATPVTRGKRYVFLPFLYDDAAARIRQENLQFVANNEPKPVEGQA